MTLKDMREKLAARKADARSKKDSIKDDMAADAVRAIEAEHAEILADIRKIEQDIEDAIAAERAAPAPASAPVVDVRAAAADAVRADRMRQKQIREIGDKLKLRKDFVEEHALGETTVDEFRALAIDEKAAAPENRGQEGTQVQVLRDEGETRARGMSDAIVARMARAAGERNVQIPEHARAYGEMSLVEIAAECIGYRGNMRTAKQVSDVLERAYAARAAGHSVTDFPSIFLDSMNKRLLGRYEAAAPTYRAFAAPYNAVDFRSMNVIRAGDFPALQAIAENGEIKSGTFSESKETFKVDPYGVRLNISRVMIVNDNMAAIDQVLGSAGVRVSDWENAKAFALLLSASGAGPTLVTDSVAVFHSTHANLAGSGTIIDIAAVGAGRAAMMKQTTLDGIKANFTPKTLLCGPDKLTQAEQLLTSITPATNATAVPESIRRLVPVADANITGNPWYLFADPAIAPTFVYGYLEGQSGPRLSSQEEFGVQGMAVKLEHDFGVGAIDYRGAYRNPGA